jgi:hypothetical protein
MAHAYYENPTEGALREGGKAATVIADIGALTSAQLTGGESPTEAEHNALQADVATVRTKVNALLAAMRTAGLLASS